MTDISIAFAQSDKEIEFISKQGGSDSKKDTSSLISDTHSDSHSGHWLSVPKTPNSNRTYF